MHPHHRRPPWRAALAGGAAVALMLGPGLAVPAGASDPHPAGPPAAAVPPPTVHDLTLVTGDRVRVTQLPDGRRTIGIDPAERDGYQPSFDTVDDGDQRYVIPSDAAPLIPDLLDRELFNVTTLADQDHASGTRVIVTHDGGAGGRQVSATAGLRATATLPSIDATAATITDGGRWWREIQAEATGATDLRALADSEPLVGVEKVWLDAPVAAALDQSVPQIGAPDAWDLGYDGTGVTVAVLDTGIDATHPDLAGTVVDEANFSGSDTVRDRHGHGTHVAGIVAGSGAASGGTYTGVAPGAELLNGKVLDDAGNGTISGVIAGMEWAAPRADVVNLSLGTRGQPSDGTDPMSQAVNQLTAQHGALFVVAAGNDGPRDETINAPGAADAALTVGSVDKADELAESSSRGPRLGDGAIKPEVTAPGVDIVSARADGSTLGPPVGDDYMRLSGTSMATPHVAGAAAILHQADPDLPAGDLKAALSSTAVPHGDLDVYQQGGGRIEVPAALHAPVLATPAALHLGRFPDPPGSGEPVSTEVTYTNRTDAAITLDLAWEVASRDGDIPSEGMLTVEPATLTVAARASGSATVTVDFAQGPVGLYGGYLVADVEGATVARTPVGFGQPDLHTLTIEGIDRAGQPVANGFGNVSIIDVHDSADFRRTLVRFRDGRLTFRLPPSTYSVMGILRTGEQFVTQDVSLVGDPELTLTGDTTLVLDARQARRVTVDTPAHVSAPRGSAVIGYVRWSENPDATGVAPVSFSDGHVERYAQPTDPVTLGVFEPHTRWRLGRPALTLDLATPSGPALDPVPMTNSPAVDGEQVLPLVDAGLGRPEDYAGVDADGAIVLARRSTIFPATLEATAAAEGAAALLVANDQPGRFLGAVSTIARIPTMSLSREEGDRLLALLDQGEVRLRLQGFPTTPFLYDLVLPEDGRIPADLGYVVHPDELASVHNAFHNDAGRVMGESRAFFRFDIAAVVVLQQLPGPHERTEYLVPGVTRYSQRVYGVYPFTARMLEPTTTYAPREQREQTWFKSPGHPGVLEGSEHTAGRPGTRTGDTLRLLLPEWVDAQRGHWGFLQGGVDTSAFRLYRDGQLVATRSRPRGSFPLSSESATYRLELDVAREADWWLTSTRTGTAWTLHSARPPEGETVVLPLLLVDYDADLDLTNTARHPSDRSGPHTVQLRVRHQPGADGPPIAGARAWVSYDDGATWGQRPVRDLGNGHFSAILDNRDPDETNGFTALKVEAWDAAGNRIEQEIIRAWRIPPR